MKTMLLSIALIVFSSASAQLQQFRLTGHLPTDTISQVALLVGEDSISAEVENRQFVLVGKITEPGFATLRLGSFCKMRVFLEAGDLEMNTDYIPGGHCLMKKNFSGRQQNLIDSFNRALQPELESHKPPSENNKLKNLVLQLVKSYPDEAAATYLAHSFGRYLGNDWSVKAYESLSVRQQGSSFGQNMRAAAAAHVKVKKGVEVPDFIQTSLSNTVFQLSSLRGKYVLIEFWASWCGPCRKENPRIKEVYEQYRDKGFEIVAVTLDDNLEKWKEAIAKDGLPWIHVTDGKGWENAVARSYSVNAIPFNVLLDRDGKIIATNLRGEMLARSVKRLF